METTFDSNMQHASTANISQASQGLIVQTYCNSVLQQPLIVFGEQPKLEEIKDILNATLKDGYVTAQYYLNELQPQIIDNISNLDSYLTLSATVPVVVPAGTSPEAFINVLIAIRDEAARYQQESQTILDNLSSVHDQFADQSRRFTQAVSQLNILVEGDEGVLASYEAELQSIENKIAGLITGIALSGVTIIGGAFVTAVGTVAGFVTAGTSVVVTAAGVGIMLGGVGGMAGASIGLANLLDAKSSIIVSEVQITEEVKIASTISSAFTTLKNRASQAVTAASNMQSAWQSIISDLDSYIDDINAGVESTEMVRTIFLAAANATIPSLKADISILKQQMAGVSTVIVPADMTINEYYREELVA